MDEDGTRTGGPHIRGGVLPLLCAVLLAGCGGDDERPRLPTAPTTGDGLLTRYVAMGQSNTAGYMSLGMNVTTQRSAYPYLLSQQAGVVFHVPEIALPGCPPPLVGPQPLTTERVGGGTEATCALRQSPFPPFVSNVAVPGSRIADFVDNRAPASRSNVLTTLILGGRTQLQAMIAARPTFVSIWPEGNEVLQAALAGNPAGALPLADFEAALDEIVAGVRQVEAEALLIGMLDVTLSPALQPGAYFFALDLAGQSPKPVLANCAPGTAGGGSLVAFSVLLGSDPAVVSCDAAAPGVLSPDEQAQIRARTAAYNAALQARAGANGWAYVDPNTAVSSVLQNPDLLRKCQGLQTAGPTGFAEAVERTCPGPQAPNFWGAYMSFDPVHYGASGHRFFYNTFAAAINAHYGTQLPPL